MNSPKQGVSNLPEICFRHGMRRVVIAPGSRNAPLIFAFTGHGKLECLSIADERSAAYFALGLALFTREPVGLICTSGTAVLNFAPAVAEAYYQNIPLVLLTADRPSEWIDQYDGQTIRQAGIYRNYIKESFELPAETTLDADLWHFNRSVNVGLNTALLQPQGPVHLNIPLREPLYSPLPPQANEIKIILTLTDQQVLSSESTEQLRKKWNKSHKKLLVLGADIPNVRRREILPHLSADPSLVIIAENISNCNSDSVISSPERFFASLTSDEFIAFQPEILITVGKSVVTGQLKKYLRQFPPAQHWHIQDSPSYVDTFQGLTHSIISLPEPLLGSLSQNIELQESSYRDTLLGKEMKIRQKHASLVSALPYSDLSVFDTLLKRIPAGVDLHLSNSTSIRYSQLFPVGPNITYHCNRGTSGIDGCISTAAGCSVASGKQTILITGDISFIYDSNGLWNKYLKGNLKIIVINNGGGNIFRLINPNDSDNPAREFFETPHKVKIKFLAEAFGAVYSVCVSSEDLTERLDWFFEPSDKPYILEIVTDPGVNTAVFKEYYKQIKLI